MLSNSTIMMKNLQWTLQVHTSGDRLVLFFSVMAVCTSIKVNVVKCFTAPKKARKGVGGRETSLKTENVGTTGHFHCLLIDWMETRVSKSMFD